jgi:nitroreductase
METALNTERLKNTATIKTIYERRAVRKYKELPVSRVIIEKILDAGRMAPSAMNEQPWRFYILTDKVTIKSFSKEIAKIGIRKVIKGGLKQVMQMVAGLLHFSFGSGILKNGDRIFYGAPVVIFISAPRDNEWAALDTGMCAQNMMLAAKSLGLDSCPIGFAKSVEQTNTYSRLQAPPSQQVHLAIIVGYGNETPEVHKRKKDNAFFIDQ